MKVKIIIAFICLFAGIANAGDAAVKRTDYKSARTGVKGISADGEGPWSNTVTVPLPNTPVIVCGQGGVNPISQNVRLLKTANTYMIWEVGQFDMVVTQLNNTQSQSGQYSGMGKIEMPFLGINLNCTFNNITVTEMMQVINGEVNVVTQGINSWVTNWQNSQYQYDDAYNYNSCIDSIYVNSSNQVVIKDCNGQITTIPNDTNGGLLITDANGNQWIVNSDGSVTPVTGGVLLPVSNQALSADEMDILRMAMLLIKNEYTENKLAQLQNTLSEKRTQLENEINTQKQSITGNASQGNFLDEESGFIGSIVTENPGVSNSKNTQFKTAQTLYNEARILRVFSGVADKDEELNFIGKYLTVNSKNYSLFVSEQLSLNKTKDEIAQLVANNGIKQLVKNIVMQKMK